MNQHPDGELVSIFLAPDEATASIVQGLLESEGIDAMVQPKRTTWAGQAALIGNIPSDGVWGEVLVFDKDTARSRELIEAYQTDESEPEESQQFDSRYTELSHRSTSGFMAVLSVGGMAWAFFGGYTVWMVFAGICALFIGLGSRYYIKTTPPRFHEAIRLYCLSYAPIGAAFLLAAANANGWITFPPVLFYLLCAASVATFLRGAVRQIPEDNRLRS